MRRFVLILLLGCGEVDQSYERIPVLDESMFAAQVEPLLEAHCANPSCHGRPERPLALYAPGRWRRDEARLFLDEPLSQEEIEHNYERSCAFGAGIDAPEQSLLLRKPLGSAYHGGGIVFEATDPAARVLEEWLWSGW